MHNAAIAHLGANYVYVPLPITAANLQSALEGLVAIGLRGFSVTIPHKQAIMPLLSDVSAIARQIGAVNTVYRTEQGWVGTNTDMAGFLAPLVALHPFWGDKTAVILGNGGAARAVVAGCRELGCREIWVVGRDRAKLEAFQHSWDSLDSLHIQPWEELPQRLASADLLVNTTPIGMYPHVHHSPLTEDDLARAKPGAIAYDLIYTPRPTQFLQHAAAHGWMTLDGLEMLVHQGAIALELWLGQPAPVEVMRQALLDQLSPSH